MRIYKSIIEAKRKQIAVLIDPDRYNKKSISELIPIAERNEVDYFFVGGSLLLSNVADSVTLLKQITKIPIVIFPGNVMQICDLADGILFLSLISGRNPDFLIGQHVVAAARLKKSEIEVIPTGYILIENGKTTSVQYMSNTAPIPADKPEIAIATAIAGEMLGFKLIYLEAGSGASESVGLHIISEVKKNISLPLVVGGGIRTAQEADNIFKSGADLIVLGTIIEENPESLTEICSVR